MLSGFPAKSKRESGVELMPTAFAKRGFIFWESVSDPTFTAIFGSRLGNISVNTLDADEREAFLEQLNAMQ